MWVASLGELDTTTKIYREANDAIEELVRKINFGMNLGVLPAFVGPPMLQSYYEYFVLDLGASAFKLTFPAT